jgi:hypothetical protein
MIAKLDLREKGNIRAARQVTRELYAVDGGNASVAAISVLLVPAKRSVSLHSAHRKPTRLQAQPVNIIGG